MNWNYTLDLWYERKFRKTCYDNTRMIRYADDWGTCFQREDEAIDFRQELEGRLAIFGLEVAPEKTKVLEFEPHAESRAKRRGTKMQTLDILGFTHYVGRSKKGSRFRMKRVTSRKKYVVKVRVFQNFG